MELIRSINSNQIEYLKDSGITVTDFEFTMQTENLLAYFIDMEINEKKLHIIISCNWDSKNGAIHVYDDTENPITDYELVDIAAVEDLNKAVTGFILDNKDNF